MGPLSPEVSGILAIFWLIMMIGMVAGCVIFLVSIWRGMKALESVAGSLREMGQK